MTGVTEVVTGFLRHNSDVLLLHRSSNTPTYPGKWGGISGIIETESPEETIRREITEETGTKEVELIRAGDPFLLDAEPTTWKIHPFLFETNTRSVTLNKEHESHQWLRPSAIPRVDTVPCLWESYHRVAPSIESLRADTEHGSTYLSIRALEILRDTATTVTATSDTPRHIRETAIRLIDARPAMIAIENRINRIMTTNHQPTTIETACNEGIDQAYAADETAASNAKEHIATKRILTHSRSGTVHASITQSAPTVFITESHPGNEGIDVAEDLAQRSHSVTVIADAAAAHFLHQRDIERVLVGADTILPDGSIINKIGTRNIAITANHENIPVFVVASIDKIAPENTSHNEHGPATELYAGPLDITVENPRFDSTPPAHITGYITEQGTLHPAAIKTIAEKHRAHRAWQNNYRPDDTS